MNDDLSDSFARWSEQVIRPLPFYGRVAAGVSTDAEVRDLLLKAPREQRLPVLLLAVVHHLLLGGAEHRLARWYPTVGGRADADGDAYDDFRDFVLGHRAEVIELVATRSTQTNEIGRCSVLRPALATAAAEVQKPLGLVDLGAAAGLNLLLDQWAYAYSPGGPRCGDPTRDVLIEAESRGARLPSLGRLHFASRVGIDMHPIPADDDEATRWLLACVWPEDLTRFRRLKAALVVASGDPPRVVSGDIVETLPSVAAAVPEDQHLAVQNSWVLSYLSSAAQERLLALLDEIGSARDLSWVSMESPEAAPSLPVPPRPDGGKDESATVTVLSTWRDGHKVVRRLAESHPHGAWVHWW